MSHEKLRQAIIAANPSLMDLSFGCQFKDRETGEVLVFLGTDRVGATLAYSAKQVDTYNDDWDLLPEEIIGSDIQLHHVLIALQKSNESRVHCIDIYGNFAFMGQVDLLSRWNLSKPFSEQSDECLSFLTELLCEK